MWEALSSPSIRFTMSAKSSAVRGFEGPRPVFLLLRRPVDAVEIGVVEVFVEGPPGLVEDGLPLEPESTT